MKPLLYRIILPECVGHITVTVYNILLLNTEADVGTPPLSTCSSLSTQDKKGFRSSFNKQVRFLANPAKPLDSNQKFYSLPHFARPLPAVPLPEEVIPETDGVKTRSRSPSPFGRLVKSLVRGSRGGNLAGLSLNTTDSRQCLICFHWIIGLSQHQTWTLCSHKSLSH